MTIIVYITLIPPKTGRYNRVGRLNAVRQAKDLTAAGRKARERLALYVKGPGTTLLCVRRPVRFRRETNDSDVLRNVRGGVTMVTIAGA